MKSFFILVFSLFSMVFLMTTSHVQARWKPETSSGFAEYTFLNTSEKNVKTEILNQMADSGYTLIDQRENLLVFVSKQRILSHYLRSEFNVIPTSNGVRVIIRDRALREGQNPDSQANSSASKRDFKSNMDFLKQIDESLRSKKADIQ